MDRATVWFQIIKSTRSSEIFKASAVDLTWIDPVGKVIKAFEQSRRRAFCDQYLHRPFADIFDAAQRITHGMLPMRIGLNGKFGLAPVDVRLQTSDVQPAHIVYEGRKLVGLMHVKTHGCGEKFFGVMRF